MNLDSIILHIRLPSQFCVIRKFDKPAVYVFIQVADKTLDRAGQIQSPEAWGLTVSPNCAPDAQPLPVFSGWATCSTSNYYSIQMIYIVSCCTPGEHKPSNKNCSISLMQNTTIKTIPKNQWTV